MTCMAKIGAENIVCAQKSTPAMLLLVAVRCHDRSIICPAALAYLAFGVFQDLGIRVVEFLGDGEAHQKNPTIC